MCHQLNRSSPRRFARPTPSQYLSTTSQRGVTQSSALIPPLHYSTASNSIPHPFNVQQELPPLPDAPDTLILIRNFHSKIPSFSIMPSKRSMITICADKVFDRCCWGCWSRRRRGDERTSGGGGGRGGCVARETNVLESERGGYGPVSGGGGWGGSGADEMGQGGEL